MYSGKNLISHISLSTWTPSQSTTYMNYETVTAAVAGTSGLPDPSLPIYRLENLNLVPDGDFALAATPAAAGWVENGGTNSIASDVWNTGNSALSFDLASTELIDYDLTQLSDGSVPGSIYTYRYRLSGNTGTYFFEIQDSTVTTNQTQYYPFIPASGAGLPLNVPADFNEHKATDFLIHSDDTEVFRINFETAGQVQIGYFDDFRIIKSDQEQALVSDIPFEDSGRVDALELLSGTYRFSIWVKADPELASRNNSFAAKAVTLRIRSYDPNGNMWTSEQYSFDPDDYSGFASWTEIYMDSTIQLITPADTSMTAISLSVFPTDVTGGAVTMDAGSILISNPSLMYSESGTF